MSASNDRGATTWRSRPAPAGVARMWEPANPYCWMLWADWFQARGLRNAREWTLREMVRLFPNSEHARVELSRLLIDRGEVHWDEAEHWLKQVMQRYPDSGHSRVVWARLLTLRHRRAEAEATLTKFVQRRPESQTAREALNRLRAGVEPGTTHDDSNANQMATSLPNALRELFRRGRLGAEFNRARIARIQGNVTPIEFIREETRKGDPLAGFIRSGSCRMKLPSVHRTRGLGTLANVGKSYPIRFVGNVWQRSFPIQRLRLNSFASLRHRETRKTNRR